MKYFLAVLLFTTACVRSFSSELPPEQPRSFTPGAALKQLLDGNERYVKSALTHLHESSERRARIANGQKPFAVILGCSDSRVPPEVIFDQGLGDIFVVRLAGNVLDETALGSIEYAAEHLHTPLIMVLGHERCGAVTAAVKGGHVPGHVEAVVKALEPAVSAMRGLPGDPVENCADANVKITAAELRNSEPILAKLVKAGKLAVVGAKYDLDSGVVELLP